MSWAATRAHSVATLSHRLHRPASSQVAAINQLAAQRTLLKSAHRFSRSFFQTTRLAYPRADAQDRESINTEATEYSKSASDDDGARQEDAAFNPNLTDPQHEKDVAGKDTEGANNPLDVSPANPQVSKPTDETDEGVQNPASERSTRTSTEADTVREENKAA